MYKNYLIKIIENATIFIIRFFFFYIVAIYLKPSDLGYFTILILAINISLTIIESGLSDFLIGSKFFNLKTFPTYFSYFLIISLFFSFLFYILFRSIGHHIYSNEVLIISSLSIIFSSINIPFTIQLTKLNNFSYLSRVSIFAMAISTFFSTLLLFYGVGFNSLIYGYFLNFIVMILFNFFKVRVIFNFSLDYSLLRLSLISSFPILFQNLMFYIYNNIRELIIGFKFTSTDLGLFNRGKIIPDSTNNVLLNSINLVNYARDSQIPHKQDFYKFQTLNNMEFLSYLSNILYSFIYIFGSLLLPFLFGPEWIEIIFYVKIFSIYNNFHVFSSIPLNSIKSMGKFKDLLNFDFLKKFISLILVLLSLFYGIRGLAFSLIFNALISIMINGFLIKKHLNISFFDLLNRSYRSYLFGLLTILFFEIFISNFSIPIFLLLYFIALLIYSLTVKLKTIKRFIKMLK
jgi:O-antigen/teichoic acid export membrane protein